MPMKWDERVRYTHEREEHIKNGFTTFKSRIRRMPPIHQATLRALLMHLSYVAAHSDYNKMNISNLAVVFSPVILSENAPRDVSLFSTSDEDTTLIDLVTFSSHIFAMPSLYQHPLPSPPSSRNSSHLNHGTQMCPSLGDLDIDGISSNSSMDANHAC